MKQPTAIDEQAFLEQLKNSREKRLEQIEDPQMRDELFFHWREYLQRLEAKALNLEKTNHGFQDAAEIRRILHTIKGDAGLFSLDLIGSVFHQSENLFEQQMEAGLCPTDILLKLTDWLKEQLDGSSPLATTPAEPPQPESLRILVADDDPSSRLLLKTILQPFGTVDLAVNGRQAVEAADKARKRQEPYNLICLDIMMPEMDGQEALARIRAKEEKSGIMSSRGAVIIMITSLDDLANVSCAYQSLCDGYLTKPVDRQKLLRELSKYGLGY